MKKSEWFGEWFDSPYYHVLYQNRDYVEAERFIGNLVNYLSPIKGSAAIDLACGKGRHAVQLNKLGLDVLGLDLSPQSIQAASFHQSDSLRFAVHDMRDQIASTPVDYVFNLFTSFGYFETQEEDVKVLNAISSVLRPGGLLVLDYMNCNQVVHSLVPKEEKALGGVQFNISRRFTGTHIEKKISFEDQGNSFEFSESVKYIDLLLFKELLKSAGLELMTTFGNYDLAPYDKNRSNRLILIVRKT